MIVKLVADPYPPYQYEDEGRVIGVDHDIIKTSLKVYGIGAETSLCSWDECMALMENRTVDGIYQITRTPERTAHFLFSEQMRTARTQFHQRTGSAASLDSTVDLVSQLRYLKIGILSGYSYNPDIDSLSDEYKVERQCSEDLLNGLLDEEYSLALMDHGVAVYLMERLGINEIETVEGYEISRPLYVAFQKDLIQLTQHFNAGLEVIRESGVYGDIFRRYGLESI
jgi:polar amino acid transport system substrate-binding protein